MKINYRKLYESHFGQIPKDETGRTYEIHHIDGNRENNDIENLVALSIQQHYEVHFNQNDYGACLRIAAKMKVSHEELSEIARKRSVKSVEDGTHPWLGGAVSSRNNARRITDGTHNFLDGRWKSELQKSKVLDGTHNFLGKGEEVRERNLKAVADGTFHMKQLNNPSRRRVDDGTHIFVSNNPSIERSKNGTHHMFKEDNPTKQRVAAGIHNFCGGELQRKMIEEGRHPAVKKVTCPHCGTTGNAAPMGRWHFDNCKHKEQN